MDRYFKFIFSAALVFSLSACLEDRPSKRQASYNPNPSWFNGATSVTNEGGFPPRIRVGWVPHSDAVGYKVYVVDKNSGSENAWKVLTTINNGSASHAYHSDETVLPGEIYTYKVKAIDANGVEDSNEIQRSTIAFEGISDVNILGPTSAEVFIASQGSFSEIQVIAHPSRLNDNDDSLDIKKSFPADTSEALIEGLLPGTSYDFRVQVTINEQGDPDGNTETTVKKTHSLGFGSGNRNQGPSEFGFRNVRLVQAFGDAPNEINIETLSTAPSSMTANTNPHQRVIKIIPNPFSGQYSGKFRVLRIPGGGGLGTLPPASFDLTRTQLCTPTETSACVVCDHNTAQNKNVENGDCDLTIGNTPPTFIDKSLKAPPQKYFYTITYVHNTSLGLWPEELPEIHANDFIFAAHVPDPYMVLAQRESVNYEVCSLMGKATNPRRHNRCAYSGIGGFPRDQSGKPLDSLFDNHELCTNPNDPSTCSEKLDVYDFGYNLLIDRHALSCNWSRPLPSNQQHACSQAEGYEKGCISLALEEFNEDGRARPEIESLTLGIGVAPNNSELPDLAVNFNDAYAENPATHLNLQGDGNNCYINIGNGTVPSTATQWLAVGALAQLGRELPTSQSTLKNRIKKALSKATTADPGPLGNVYTNRKQPAVTGLASEQAQALCDAHTTSYGSSKRLMRRREYIASTSFPSSPGEPGFTTQSEVNAIASGRTGSTIYDYRQSDGSFGGGTHQSLGENPGGCTNGALLSAMATIPMRCEIEPCTIDYNPTLPKWSASYCNDPEGCILEEHRVGGISESGILAVDGSVLPFSDLLSEQAYLDEKNENTSINSHNPGRTVNGNTHQAFIGSLATNKCVTRYGTQDPFVSSGGQAWNRRGTTGFVFSDRFEQTVAANLLTSSSPRYIPLANDLDPGVYFDYTYISGGNNTPIEFNNTASGYSGTPVNGRATTTCESQIIPAKMTWLTDSYFFLSSQDTREDARIGTCGVRDGLQTHQLALTPSRNYNFFPNYLPFMGLPLSQNAKTLNPNQDLIPFSSFLFGNQFGTSHSHKHTLAKFYVTKPGPINMSSGANSRWSYDLSESSEVNNSGMSWCVVEVD